MISSDHAFCRCQSVSMCSRHMMNGSVETCHDTSTMCAHSMAVMYCFKLALRHSCTPPLPPPALSPTPHQPPSQYLVLLQSLLELIAPVGEQQFILLQSVKVASSLVSSTTCFQTATAQMLCMAMLARVAAQQEHSSAWLYV